MQEQLLRQETSDSSLNSRPGEIEEEQEEKIVDIQMNDR